MKRSRIERIVIRLSDGRAVAGSPRSWRAFIKNYTKPSQPLGMRDCAWDIVRAEPRLFEGVWESL